MARWEPNARGRLERAALELFGENGYDQTTVAEIAERAGVTERTFFRHFGDKREVLFDPSHALQNRFVEAVTGAPEDTPPIELVVLALESAGAFFEDRRPHALRRQAVIDTHPGLRERELIKLDSLATALAAALRDRGTPAPALTAEVAVAVFRVGFAHWISAPDTPDAPALTAFLHASLTDLGSLTAPA
ncbi:TetR/AcrR family transcriptional regulator [Actinocorallia herbida]|nr:TetR/AcrR family transcriptional regulator [Actinocorallia herbida]